MSTISDQCAFRACLLHCRSVTSRITIIRVITIDSSILTGIDSAIDLVTLVDLSYVNIFLKRYF